MGSVLERPDLRVRVRGFRVGRQCRREVMLKAANVFTRGVYSVILDREGRRVFLELMLYSLPILAIFPAQRRVTSLATTPVYPCATNPFSVCLRFLGGHFTHVNCLLWASLPDCRQLP